MVGIALLGAGIFAREQHLPAIESSPHLTLKAIYSRTSASATSLASAATDPSAIDTYFAVPAPHPDRTLAALLARADIAAVVVCLPILAQPAVVRQALEAGKHVLSEKPVAGDVAAARALLAWWRAFRERRREAGQAVPIWGVAENFRFVGSLAVAARRLGEVGGEVTAFQLRQFGHVDEDNKYYQTEWRKTPEYQGGFLLDAGVHYAAGLRLLLGAVNTRLATVSAASVLLNARLAPVDTLYAVGTTSDGALGSVSMTFGTEFKSGLEIEVVTTRGRVCWEPKSVKVVRRTEEGDDAARGERNETLQEKRRLKEEVSEYEWDSGVTPEVHAFADGVVAGQADPRQAPEEALLDLGIMEALLESGRQKGKTLPVDG